MSNVTNQESHGFTRERFNNQPTIEEWSELKELEGKKEIIVSHNGIIDIVLPDPSTVKDGDIITVMNASTGEVRVTYSYGGEGAWI